MLQLQPLEIFPIVRGLETADGNTNYVQAVIRNALTDAVIATVNLSDKGDHQRYAATWQVPQDPTGLGMYIIITSSVYTDSGYSSKSQNFGDKFDTYIIQQRMNPALMGSGGGSDVDYKRVRKIVQEELAALPKPEPIEFPDMPNIPFHLQPVLNALSGLRNDLQAVDIPSPDFSGVEYRLGLIEKAVKAIPQTDLSPVLSLLGDVKQTLLAEIEEAEDELTQTGDANTKGLAAKVANAIEVITALKKKFESTQVLRFDQPPEQEKPEPIDYNLLLAPKQ